MAGVGESKRAQRAQAPAMEPIAGLTARFEGEVGRRIEANERHWLLTAPDANPAMLDMLRDRDAAPVRDLVPWAGEFAGKYLTSAVLCLRITRSEVLREHIVRFVRDLVALQAPDGYLGAFPEPWRLTGRTIRPDGKEGRTWDAWNHYHCMMGLLLWHEDTGDRKALAACCRIADLLCRRFSGTCRLVATGSEEMNLAPIHALCLLYARTGEARYLAMAREIESDFEAPTAGDYIRTALAGKEFHETPKPRWESLHAIQGIGELYGLTGDPRYRQAFEHIWWSILKGDRHSTGGFSSGEKATGNPYDPAAIETCCTIAWAALTLDFLRLSGLSLAADELELSTLNAILGAQSPSGRWWTYNTPMDGCRMASAHHIVFQARPGSPELNCCSVNGPRGLGMLSQWAVMAADGGLAVNYYGPSSFAAKLPSGAGVRLSQETAYPLDGRVRLTVEPSRAAEFPLLLRVPVWSRRTRLTVNGRPERSQPGRYARIERRWRRGDTVEVALDMSLRAWVGERECEGRAALYRGPVLLAFDQRYNLADPASCPTLALDRLRLRPAKARVRGQPWMLWKAEAADGCPVLLCDFAGAGQAGNPYRSWLPAAGAEPAPFSRDDPTRTRPLR